MKTGTRSYSEMILLPTFEERFEYLKLGGSVGKETFGWDRIFNQEFYHSREWKTLRRDVIARDLFDIDNFICCSHRTHEAIHYGDAKLLIPTNFAERRPGDTKLW